MFPFKKKKLSTPFSDEIKAKIIGEMQQQEDIEETREYIRIKLADQSYVDQLNEEFPSC